MLSLNDREWKAFKIDNLFITEAKGNIPTGGYVKKEQLENGTVPRITVTSRNNGIDNYWADIKDNSYRAFENFISVSFLGDVFYHKTKASIDMKVHSLQLKGRALSDGLAAFLCRALRNNTKISTYGNQLSSYDLARKSIMLPVNSNGQPDYDFMEAYVKQQEQAKVDTYAQHCKVSLIGLGKQTKICEISQKEWHEFFVDDIFTIDSGKRLESYNMTAGSRPFIGATDSGNGVTNYISNENESLDRNVLGVNYNGNGMVISFYHPYECLFSDDVKRFHLKNHSDNKYVLLFFKALILQQKAKYNYGYKFNATRMKRQKIMLPVTEDGKPDYEYMEQYAKNMMIQKYQEYLDYIKK